jgi:hypothetical protein
VAAKLSSRSQYALMEISTPLESLLRTEWPRRPPRRRNRKDQEFSNSSAESETPSEFSLESDGGSSDTSEDLAR